MIPGWLLICWTAFVLACIVASGVLLWKGQKARNRHR